MRTALFISILFYFSCSSSLQKQLNNSGKRKILKKEIVDNVSLEERSAMEWLINHMPEDDLQNLSSDYLTINSEYAFKTKKYFVWAEDIPDEIFLNYVVYNIV